jgi:hypothetical protein
MLPVVIQVLINKKSKIKGNPVPLMSDEKLDRLAGRWVLGMVAVALFFGAGYWYNQVAA